MKLYSRMLTFNRVKDGKEGKQGPMPVNSGEWDRSVEYIKDGLIQPYVWQMHNDKKHYYLLVADKSKGDDPYLNNTQGSGNIWRYHEKYDLFLARKIQADEIDVDTIISRTIDSMELGGRNLFIVNGFIDVVNTFSIVPIEKNNHWMGGIRFLRKLEVGKQYTLFCKIRMLEKASGTPIREIFTLFCKDGSTFINLRDNEFQRVSNGETIIHRYVFTHEKPIEDFVRAMGSTRTGGFDKIEISEISVFEGNINKRGSWTPAPEDYGSLAYEDEVNLAQLGETIIQGGHIRTELIETESLIAKYLKTGRSGPRIEASGSELKVYGRGEHPNIVFGVNNDGYAVLAYYTSDGSLIYDLGPRGINWGSIKPSAWIEVKLVETNVFDEEPTYRDFNFYASTDDLRGRTYYNYFAGSNPTITEEEREKEKYTYSRKGDFTQMIGNGWYMLEGQPEETRANNTTAWVTPFGDKGLYEFGSSVRDIPPIYFRYLMRFKDGIQVDTKFLCWNGAPFG